MTDTREEWGRWLIETLSLLMVNRDGVSSFAEVEQSFNDSGAGDFQHFLNIEAFTKIKGEWVAVVVVVRIKNPVSLATGLQIPSSRLQIPSSVN